MNFTQNDIEFVKNLDVCEYKKIQSIAKNVLDEIKSFIKPENAEKEIVEECKLLLKKHGKMFLNRCKVSGSPIFEQVQNIRLSYF